jgi:hypothetical protein
MKLYLIGFGIVALLCAIVALSCCVASGRANERLDKWRFTHKEVDK